MRVGCKSDVAVDNLRALSISLSDHQLKELETCQTFEKVQ